ncbi:MAG: carboxylesterase family protein, partial [Woeseiaceae bacterium]|nr:carboxylesterase family protein [Woeseiaceae bacterium]
NVLALMFAEPARSLFQRTILQSAANYGLSMPTLDDERQRGIDLGRVVGAETLERLREVPADELLEMYTDSFSDHYHSPAIDGQLITESTWEDIQARDFAGHQLMVGTNNAEWLGSVSDDTTVDDVLLAARNNPRIGGDKAIPLIVGEDDPRRAMDRLITADAYLCPSQNVAANRTASGGSAWMYFFSRVREDEAAKAFDAFHGAEYSYVFGVHDDYMTTTATDHKLAATMQKYWINFAATGNPNGAGIPEWPMFKHPDPLVQELGDEIRTVPALEPEMCAAFEEWNDQQK